jgi:hypothetical protein
VIETFSLRPISSSAKFFAGPAHHFGQLAVIFDEAILEWFAMPDERRAHAPTPLLKTRPATMLTAIGLCAMIIVMQLVPDIRDMTSNRAPVTVLADTR